MQISAIVYTRNIALPFSLVISVTESSLWNAVAVEYIESMEVEITDRQIDKNDRPVPHMASPTIYPESRAVLAAVHRLIDFGIPVPRPAVYLLSSHPSILSSLSTSTVHRNKSYGEQGVEG
jgi:hypothetical protein